MVLIVVGCSSANDEIYSPSIASLNTHETLIMNLSACHNGCTKGKIKFSDGEATNGQNSLKLTTEEIAS